MLLVLVMAILPAGVAYASRGGIENDVDEGNYDRFGTTSPWMSGTQDESIYGNPIDAGEGGQDISVSSPGMVENYIAELVRNIASSLISLLQDNIGASIDSIVYGRVGSGYPNKVNIYAFELRKGNPYGVTAAVCYALLRGMMFVFLGVEFVFQLAKAAWSGQTAKSRDEIKSILPTLLVKFCAMMLMPYLLDVALYVRDVLLYGIKEVTGQMVAGGATLSLSKAFLLNAERSGTFVDAVMYLGTVVLTIYFVFIYVAVAIDMLVCFISFPFICVLHSRKKDLINGWVMTVFSNLMTPVIDAVLLLIPLLTSIMLSDVVKGVAVIQLVMCMLIIPARLRFKTLLGIQSNERNGFLGAMAAMTMARALASRIKQGVGKIADAFSDARKSRAFGELAEVDREEEEALLSGDGGKKDDPGAVQGGGADDQDALHPGTDGADPKGDPLRPDDQAMGDDKVPGGVDGLREGADPEADSVQSGPGTDSFQEQAPTGNTKGDALREMDQQMEQSQNTLDSLRMERAEMVQKDKQLRRQMLNHERGSEQYKRLERERADAESRTAAIDLKIAKESGKLNRLRSQSKELHAAFGMRNTPTQFEERRAAILQKRANIANFEQPEFRGVLSNEQMRNLYRNRAIANTAKAVVGTAGSIAGGAVLGSSAVFLGASGVAMAASGGIHVGGSIGETAVDLTTSAARLARPVARGVGNATYHAADMAASAYLMHKIRPAAMQVSMDLGNVPFSMPDEDGPLPEEGNTPVIVTGTGNGQDTPDINARIIFDTNNVIARTISTRGTPRNSTMLHALQQANVQLERELAVAREEGSVMLTEETIRERRAALQTGYLTAEIMAQMEATEGYQRNTEAYAKAEELIRGKIEALLAERDKPLI